MEEKKTIKISLSTFFLIFAIVVIIIMGYFIYKIYNEKINETKTIANLNDKINDLENTVINVSKNESSANIVENKASQVQEENKTSTTNSITYSLLKGTYKSSAKAPYGEIVDVTISLNQDGTFYYNYVPGFETHYEGYYTIDENKITLHVLLDCGNDIGATITNETLTLTINSDNSLTDNDKLKTTFKKSSNNTIDVNLTNSIKSRLQQGVLK